jgi:hypothetical protein
LLDWAVCRLSCTETFRSTNTRAVSTSDNPRSRAASRATLFQIDMKLVAVPVPVVAMPAHNRAIDVCSLVRAPLSDLPISFTSFRSVA